MIQMRRWKEVRRILSLLICMCMAYAVNSGCAVVENRWERGELDKYVVALAYSPQLSDMGMPWVKSYIFLIASDGGYRIIPIEEMGTNQTLWTREGLFFSDKESRYSINSETGFTRTLRPVEENDDVLNAIVPSAQGTPIFIYDLGFYELGKNRLKVDIPSEHVQYTVNRNPLSLIARCGVTLYGASYEGDMSEDIRPVFSLLDMDVRNHEKKIIGDSNKLIEDDGLYVPCVHERISFLESENVNEESDVSRYFIGTWDVSTQRIEHRAITDAQGGVVKEDSSRGSTFLLREDDDLFFLNRGTGILRRVNVQTGKVDKTSRFKSDGNGTYFLASNDAYICIAYIDTVDRQSSLSFYDPDTLEKKKEIPLSDELQKNLQSYKKTSVMHVSINPQFR